MKISQLNRFFAPAAAVFLALAFNAGARAEDSSSGCGMGWKVAPKNSLISSTTRAYVNMTFSSTVGMTLGTSGCTRHSIVQREMRAVHYAEANQGQLMIEIAQGRGEHLRGLVSTLGCSPDAYEAAARSLQANYQSIFPAMSSTPAAQMLQGVKSSISKDSALSRQCGLSS